MIGDRRLIGAAIELEGTVGQLKHHRDSTDVGDPRQPLGVAYVRELPLIDQKLLLD